MARSAELRLRLASESRPLQASLAAIDQAREGVNWLRSHPQWSLGALALLLVLRPKRTLRWASRLLWGWGLYQRLQQVLASKPQRP